MTAVLMRPPGMRPAYLEHMFAREPAPQQTPSLHSTSSSVTSCSSSTSSYDLRAAYSHHNSTRPLTPAADTTARPYSPGGSPRTRKSPISFPPTTTLHTNISPRRFRFGGIFARRASAEEATEVDEIASTTSLSSSSSATNSIVSISGGSFEAALAPAPLHIDRRPSLPLLVTAFPPPPHASVYARKPLPMLPGQATPARRPLPTPFQSARPSTAQPKSQPQQHAASRSQELTCRRCYYFNARHCHGWVFGGTAGDACETCLQAGFFGEK